ncbi:hypothetical protein EJ573_02940 [Paenibacillus polymyxa]|uniref:hypothetical protein n=1 Tax=Paenibacillus polymyxa TaxID=1406 RepID=UPI000F887BCC|nr:hypothetical protein [Paenibacillus polymyxa]RTZ38174.1 hypothetical protein EJ573_02940 [Paenibacillus polymyxa]
MSNNLHARIVSTDQDKLKGMVEKFNSDKFNLLQVGEEIFIESTLFKDLDDPVAVYTKAENLLKTFSGLMILNSGLHNINVSVNGVANLSTNEYYLYKVNFMDLHGSLIVANETTTAKNPANNPERWVELFLVDENVKEAFDYARLGLNDPVIMYSIYEIIRKDVNRKFSKISEKYTNNNAISSFTGTLNDPREIGEVARHAVPLGKDRMANPMTLNECSDFIRELLHDWIHYKLTKYNL